MFDYLQAIIYGLVQGATEFLPISSSGHLVLLHNYWQISIVNDLVFDVWLHLATLLAVVFYFRLEIKQIILAWLKSFSKKRTTEGKLAWLIVIGSIPAAFIGVLLGDYIENLFRSPPSVALMLVLVGILFILIERISRQNFDLDNLSAKQAFLVGLAQAVALIPGTSRSGITIIAGMATNLKRSAAVKFSFLLSIPIIAGAWLVKIPDLVGADFNGDGKIILVVGFIAAFFSAFFAIKWLIKYTCENTLHVFAYYRFLLAAVILISYFWR